MERLFQASDKENRLKIIWKHTMNRITLIGAVFLALIAILPTIIGRFLGVPQTISYFFGGTALLDSGRCRTRHHETSRIPSADEDV